MTICPSMLWRTLHLPSTVALAARDGLGALAGAGAAAVVAAQGRAQRDGHGGTEHRLLERDVGHHFQVLPPRRAGRPAVAATERAATATEEGVEQVAQAATAEPVAGVCAADALLAEPVVAGTCLRVAERFVRAGHLLELLLGSGVARVRAGVQLARTLPVGLLQLVGGGGAWHAQQFVEVSHWRSRRR